ncbi:unknown [Prevotella sp. CAG:891]|nr:unknown [Prevotella sp. CAG:891]
MLIVQYYKKISIPKLQVCLWGVQLDENLQMIQVWKKYKRISNAPWIADEDITPLVMQCVSNHLLKLETKKDKVNVVLDVNANNFISEISNIEIGQEINDDLQQMGKLSDTLLKNIEFDF